MIYTVHCVCGRGCDEIAKGRFIPLCWEEFERDREASGV